MRTIYTELITLFPILINLTKNYLAFTAQYNKTLYRYTISMSTNPTTSGFPSFAGGIPTRDQDLAASIIFCLAYAM